MNGRRRAQWWLPAALLLAAVAAAPLLLEPGFLNTRGGGDSPFLLQRLHQLEQAILGGHFPARWMPDANYGFGYPFFNYYAPLSIYVALFFRLLGFGYVHALELAQLAGFLVAAAGAFGLARRWWDSPWAGILAAAAYTYAPFHLVNVYVRGDSLAEFWAMAFYPLTLLAMDRVVERGETGRFPRGAVALLALAYGGLVLSHNISALIFSPFLLFYGLLRLRRPWPRPLLLLGTGAGLGLLLSLWFWLPALAESGIAQTDPVTSGYFSYQNHFRGTDLVQGALLFDYDVSGGGAFRMGLIQALLSTAGALVALWSWRRNGGDRAGILFGLLALLGATFMITPLSRPLWEQVPLLSFTQFPWRFLSIQALGGALLLGSLARLPRPPMVVPLLVGLLLVSGMGRLETDELRLTDADVTAERLAEYEWFSGNIGTTVSAEYLPRWAVPRPFSSAWLVWDDRDRASFVAGQGRAMLLSRDADAQEWSVAAGSEGAAVVLPLLYWPGWAARSGDEPLPLEPAAGSGLVTVTLPPGEHVVELRLRRTPLRLAAELSSAVGLLVLLVMALPAVRKWSWRRRRIPIATAGALLLAVTAAAWLWPQRAPERGTLSWDFAQRGYLHGEPAGIPFAGNVLLQRYAYENDTVAAGESWTVDLLFAGAPPGATVTVALEQPGVTRFPLAPTIAATTEVVEGERGTIRLTVPENAPPGLLLPRLTLRDGAGNRIPAVTEPGAPRGALFLRPLRIAPAASTANAPPTGGRELDVRSVEVAQRDRETLNVGLAWATNRPLGANYAASLRLVDGAGAQLSQLDVQPGYGFLPTSSWPANTAINDWLALPLPEIADAPRPLALVARLYEVESGEAVLTRRLGTLSGTAEALAFQPQTPQTTIPDDVIPIHILFGTAGGDQIALPGYRVERQDEEALALTLFWQAVTPPGRSYRHFVHVIDPATGEIVAQHDAIPQNNSYPTDQWTVGEVVADPALVLLEGVPAGTYTVAAGLYYQQDDAFTRLPTTPMTPDDAVELFDLTVETTADR